MADGEVRDVVDDGERVVSSRTPCMHSALRNAFLLLRKPLNEMLIPQQRATAGMPFWLSVIDAPAW